MPDIFTYTPPSHPDEWEGDIHTLIVRAVDEPEYPGDPGDLDYDVEHPPSCTQETCDVAENEYDVGLASSLHYSGTPITAPGTYRIRAWGRKYQTELGDEYDGGVAVITEDEDGA